METPAKTHVRAQALRRMMSRTEVILWVRLRRRKVAGKKFRSQHPIGPYILDFYCPAARLAVEVDGNSHSEELAILHDKRRTAWLQRQGVETLRVRAVDVMGDPDRVTDHIASVVLDRLKDLDREPTSPGAHAPAGEVAAKRPEGHAESAVGLRLEAGRHPASAPERG